MPPGAGFDPYGHPGIAWFELDTIDMHSAHLECVKIVGPNDPRWGPVGVPRPGIPGGLP